MTSGICSQVTITRKSAQRTSHACSEVTWCSHTEPPDSIEFCFVPFHCVSKENPFLSFLGGEKALRSVTVGVGHGEQICIVVCHVTISLCCSQKINFNQVYYVKEHFRSFWMQILNIQGRYELQVNYMGAQLWCLARIRVFSGISFVMAICVLILYLNIEM